jgi:ketosteroid isomerase-like protein
MLKQRIEEMFKRVDAMDVEGYLRHVTDDIRFRFGSAPEVSGKAAVRDTVGQFFSSIGGIKHALTGVWESGETAIVRLEVEYTRKDGSKITLPCANIFEFRDERIADYRVYMDVTPVFA